MTRMRTLIGCLALALAVAACGGGDGDSDDSAGGSGEKTFSDDRFALTFTYPEEFETGTVEKITKSAGQAEESTALTLDEQNGIILQKYTLNVPVTQENLAEALPQIDQTVSGLVGTPTSGTAGTTGGFPSVTYEAVAIPDPPQAQSRLAFLFDGTTEYLVNCQSTPAERAEVDQACDRALATLQRTQ